VQQRAGLIKPCPFFVGVGPQAKAHGPDPRGYISCFHICLLTPCPNSDISRAIVFQKTDCFNLQRRYGV